MIRGEEDGLGLEEGDRFIYSLVLISQNSYALALNVYGYEYGNVERRYSLASFVMGVVKVFYPTFQRTFSCPLDYRPGGKVSPRIDTDREAPPHKSGLGV